MKKLFLGLLVAILVILAFASTVLAEPKPKEPIDKITFIHYKNGEVKITGRPRTPTCYSLMGIKWRNLPISYVIDPTNSGMSINDVVTAITASTNTWDAATRTTLFDGYTIGPGVWDDSSPIDYKNDYVFGAYPDSNVIAVTNVWYTRYGKQIVDYDVLFNTYYNWFDCSKKTCDAKNNGMDLQNIATHETGHGLGLADIYNNACSAVTMYGFSSYGETQKRTLEQPDITGLQTMYGA
jgi:hypothetical protein